MLKSPKGLEYWIEEDGKFVISDDAPDWAKREFEEYQEQMDSIGEKDEDGLIKLQLG